MRGAVGAGVALTLWAARHAETDAAGLCVGQHDVATLITHEQAAGIIRDQLPRIPDVVHSSPLSRCRGPAALLAAAWGRPHRVDARLLEIDYGRWQGRTWTDIERDDADGFAHYMQHWQESPPPGGERLGDLERRVGSWHAELGDGGHLLVAHAGVVRALRVLIAGADWTEAMRQGVPNLELETLAV